ncbi:MAG: hypothetical protein WCT33_03420 [Patescibacteria group bacterium]|jgi:type II secretory pathway component PulJ
MYRSTRILIMAVILMAVLSTIVSAATEITLSAAQQEQILKLQAAGKLAQADSLKTVFTAQVQLATQKAAAAEELKKLEQKKQADREATWAKTVARLSFEECLQWTADDSTGSQVEKIGWLSKRWVTNYGFKPIDPKATLNEVLMILQDQVNERRDAAKRRAEIDARVGSAINPLQEQINAGARADVRLAQFIGNLNGQVTDLQNRVAALEAWQPTVDSRLNILLNTANEGRVNIAACMRALSYAKYNSSPENAKHATKFIADAKANTQPVTFPANDTK